LLFAVSILSTLRFVSHLQHNLRKFLTISVLSQKVKPWRRACVIARRFTLDSTFANFDANYSFRTDLPLCKEYWVKTRQSSGGTLQVDQTQQCGKLLHVATLITLRKRACEEILECGLEETTQRVTAMIACNRGVMISTGKGMISCRKRVIQFLDSNETYSRYIHDPCF